MHSNLHQRRAAHMKIIIVEDHHFFRELIYKTLISNFPSSEIMTFENSEEALPEIKNQHFDVAIVDISLPGENGLKLTQKIRAIYPDIKIIIYTNHNLPEYREAAFEFGADQFLSKKDKNPEDLVLSIKSMI